MIRPATITGGFILVVALLVSLYLRLPNPELNWKLVEDLAYTYAARSSSGNVNKSSPLNGVTIVITGATSGIGKGLASATYKLGATVVAIGRSPSKLAALKTDLEKKYKENNVNVDLGQPQRLITVVSDFSDLESVSNASKIILSKISSLDFLVNNAGIGYYLPLPSYLTAQGYDLCFGVNYLSHFLLSEKLIPLLQKSKFSPRIIQMSSTFHWQVDERELIPSLGHDGIIDNNSPIASRNEEDKPLPRAYANSKLSQILHSRSMSKRFKNNTIKFVNVCPGWVRTNILNDGKGQVFLKTFGFPLDGVGLSSTFNGMFRPNVGIVANDTSSNDFIANWDMHFLLINNLLSKWASTFWIRDAYIMAMAGTVLPVLQKTLFNPYLITDSSPESYNATVQEALYKWSKNAVEKWL